MNKKRILVIEDVEEIRENLLDILDSNGFETAGASNGKIGLQIAKEFQPDLILCDVDMPELNGYDVLKYLHQDPQLEAIPFIFLTALADMKSLRQGMACGADDYLTKPVHIDELLEAIATRLSRTAVVSSHYTNASANVSPPSELNGANPEKLFLSPLQTKILQLIEDGKKTSEIAKVLHIGLEAAEFLESVATRLSTRLHRQAILKSQSHPESFIPIQEDRLTPRQLEILKLVAKGMTTKEIASELFISVKTVETHRGQMMERLNIRELAGLVRHAIRIGLIDLNED
ncbi:response regulator transcription factor [Tumidithrix elongata RA019]|uniref:Response regulator transcription factor n=1 Tax=Tumidithrix elongata BACA0141 TaxID=2716417 RepID=A0AAW9Q1L6_9CYAN|nr:response regulator transcription factor [Tumidithrix elongata RA019]